MFKKIFKILGIIITLISFVFMGRYVYIFVFDELTLKQFINNYFFEYIISCVGVGIGCMMFCSGVNK